MGLHLYPLQEDFVVARGLLNYVCYRSHCVLVHEPLHTEEEVLELMKQQALEAIRGQALGKLYEHFAVGLEAMFDTYNIL